MTRLQLLYREHGQSPWLDNLTRPYLRDGTLERLVADGIRGVTANPTIFAKAIEGSDAYDEQFSSLIALGRSVPEAYSGVLPTPKRWTLRRGGPMLYVMPSRTVRTTLAVALPALKSTATLMGLLGQPCPEPVGGACANT